MRGRFHKVVGRIVESPDAPVGATGPTLGSSRTSHFYTVEVPTPKGQPLLGSVELTSLFIHMVGEPMAVEVNFKTGEMVLDKQAEAQILKRQAESMRTTNSLNQTDRPDPSSGPSWR